jgi:hypothetical protein
MGNAVNRGLVLAFNLCSLDPIHANDLIDDRVTDSLVVVACELLPVRLLRRLNVVSDDLIARVDALLDRGRIFGVESVTGNIWQINCVSDENAAMGLLILKETQKQLMQLTVVKGSLLVPHHDNEFGLVIGRLIALGLLSYIAIHSGRLWKLHRALAFESHLQLLHGLGPALSCRGVPLIHRNVFNVPVLGLKSAICDDRIYVTQVHRGTGDDLGAIPLDGCSGFLR